MKMERRYKTKIIIPFVTMADIAFLLLIFLIVTSSVQKKPAIKISVPESSVFDQIERKGITEIFIDAKERIYFNNETIELKDLKKFIPENKNCIISADREVKFNKIYKIFNILKEVRYEKITFVIKRKSTPINR